MLFFFLSHLCLIQQELSALRLSLGNQQLIDSIESSSHQVGDGILFTICQTRFGCCASYLHSASIACNLVCAKAACARVQPAERCPPDRKEVIPESCANSKQE